MAEPRTWEKIGVTKAVRVAFWPVFKLDCVYGRDKIADLAKRQVGG
jgi:hypothetical protein